MRPTILIDVDGPLTSSYVEQACEFLRGEGVHHAQPEAVKHYRVADAFGLDLAVRSRLDSHMAAPGRAMTFVPRQHAKEVLNTIRAWAEVYAVTSPLDGARTWAYDREEWLTRYLDFRPERVISTRAKGLITGHVLIDDEAHNLDAWGDRQDGQPILWKAPYDADVAGYHVVTTLPELVPLMESIFDVEVT